MWGVLWFDGLQVQSPRGSSLPVVVCVGAFGVQANVGALIIRIGVCEFLIIVVVQYTRGPTVIMPKNPVSTVFQCRLR